MILGAPRGENDRFWGSRGPIWALPGAPWIKLFPREYQGSQEIVKFLEKIMDFS